MSEDERQKGTDPEKMLDFLRSVGLCDDRRSRLFAVACCRRIWNSLSDERSRRAGEVAERYADGRADEAELEAAWHTAFDDVVEARPARDFLWAEMAAARAVLRKHEARSWWKRAAETATAAAFAASQSAGKPPECHDGPRPGYQQAGRDGRRPRWLSDETLRERAVQADLLRDVFGPSAFRSVAPPSPAVLAWGGGCVRMLASVAYRESDFSAERLAVLADALEEAGHDDEEVLRHCRQGGQHVKGCWVIDWLLGGEE